MAKTKISEWSTTPASNTDIDGINIAEGCAPSGINDAIRDLMAQVRSWQSGASGDPFNGPMNGTIGATTAYSGAFTTVSATGVITSTLATGTAPLTIASTTKVANLNVDLLDGADWASPAALGSTTPAAVSATTLSASGAVTLSGGTANGVTYLNGSKVLTSGSALVFDGTNLSVGTTALSGGKFSTLADLTAVNGLVVRDSATTYANNDNFVLLQNSTGATAGGLTHPAASSLGVWGNDDIRFLQSSSATEQMRLTSTGLGIGTSSPGYRLTAAGASTAGSVTALAIENPSSNAASEVRQEWRAGGTTFGYITVNYNSNNPYMAFATGQSPITEQMRLTSTGLGIGTSSPAVKLQVNSGDIRIVQTNNSANNGLYFRNSADSGTYAKVAYVASTGELQVGTTDAYSLLLQTNNTTKATLDSSGNLGLGVTPSAWGSIFRAQQIGAGNSFIAGRTDSVAGRQIQLGTNAYYNGTNWIYGLSQPAAKYYLNDNTHVWEIAPSGTAGNAISFTQAMTLDASGNLAIGLTSASARLHLGGSANNEIRVDTTASGYLQIGQFANGAFIGTSSTDATAGILRLGTGGTERARIDTSGNLLVGQTTKGQTTVGFYASGNGEVSGCQAGSTSGNTQWNTYSTGAGAYRFYVGMQGTVYATNTTITAISDQRLKENIVDLDVGLDAIMALKPRKFDWKAGKGKDIKGDRGWIAQEFETVFPDLIDTWKDPAPEGEEPYKSVRADLIPVLVKAIQEQQAIIESLKARLDAANL